MTVQSGESNGNMNHSLMFQKSIQAYSSMFILKKILVNGLNLSANEEMKKPMAHCTSMTIMEQFHLQILSAVQNYTIIVEANSEDFVYFSSGTKVFSPIKRTYNSRFLTLNLTFGAGLGIKCSLNYTIDDKYEGEIPLVLKNSTELYIVNKATGIVALPELAEGSHCLTINVLCGLYNFHGANPPGAPFKPTSPGSADYEATWSDNLYFTVDTGSENEIPEFPAWTVLPAILSVTVVVVMLRKTLKNQKGEDNVE